jgi:hypothetical protein
MREDSLPQFLEACGGTGPLQLNVEQPCTQETISRVFQQPFLLIGRSPQADLRLSDPAVSFRHAYLQVIGGRVFCIDLHSRTGLRLNGKSDSSVWLSRDETLGIGPYRLRLMACGRPPNSPFMPEEPVNPLFRLPPDHDPLPGVSLAISMEGTAKRTSWRVNRLLTLVGAAPECKLRVAAAADSKFLCSLLRTPSGLWVIDLLSEQGIRVNGVRVPWAHLREGDQLQVGTVLLHVHYEEPTTSWAAQTSELIAPRLPLREKAMSARSAPTLVSPCTGALILPTGGADESVVLALANQFAAMQQNMFDQMTQALLIMGQMFGRMQDNQMQLIREELDQLREVTQDLQGLQAKLVERQCHEEEIDSVEHSLARNGTRPVTPQAFFPRRASPPNGSTATSPGPASKLPEEDVHAELCERIAALQEERQSRWQRIFNFLTRKKPGESTSIVV